jgi:hypothetical protein
MTVGDFAILLIRHPVVVLLAFLLTVGGMLRIVTEPPIYQSRAVVNFVMPGSAAFENFNVNLVVAASVTSLRLNSSQGEERVRARGGTAPYKVVLANRGNDEQPVYDQPYVTLLVTSPDPVQVGSTLTALQEVLRADLSERQLASGARPNALISARVVESSDKPTPFTGRRARALAALAVFGALLMVAGAMVAERHPIRLGRRWRRPAAPAVPAPSE